MGHRRTLIKYHDRRLVLNRSGSWVIEDVGTPEKRAGSPGKYTVAMAPRTDTTAPLTKITPK